MVRRLRAADGPRLRAPRPDVAGDARRALDRLPPARAARGAAARRARSSSGRGRRTRRRASGRYGRRTSSGSSCRGASIPTARSASASTSSPRTGRARSSGSRSSTAGSSRTPCRACPRPRRRKASRRSSTCGSTALPHRGRRLREPRQAASATKDSTARTVDPVTKVVKRGGQRARRRDRRRRARRAFPTPSRKLEFFSKTLKDWKWPEQAVPGYMRSQVHWSNLDRDKGEMALLPTFRLPTLIHTRSGNSKWLTELSHTNPIWMHPEDARRLGVGDRRSGEGRDRHRLVRRPRVGHRGAAARRRRVLPPHRPLAARGDDRRRAVVDRAGRAQERRARSMAHAPGARRAPVRERGPRHEPHLVGGSRRQPEPDVPRAARPGVGPALLAPEGARDEGRPRRPLRRHHGRHGEVARGVPRVAQAWRAPRRVRAISAARSGCRARSSPTRRAYRIDPD